MHATLTNELLRIATTRKVSVHPLAIESTLSAMGHAVDSATVALEAHGGKTFRGFSTDPHTVKQVLAHLGTDSPHVLISECSGNFFSANGYPYVYSEALRSGTVGPTTTCIPAEGATIWRPASTRTIAHSLGTTAHIGTKVAYLNVTNPPTGDTSWGLIEHYTFGADSDQAQEQLDRRTTSTITITLSLTPI